MGADNANSVTSPTGHMDTVLVYRIWSKAHTQSIITNHRNIPTTQSAKKMNETVNPMFIPYLEPIKYP